MLFNISVYGFHLLLFFVVFNSSFKYIYSSGIWNLLQISVAFIIIVLGFLDPKSRLIINTKSLVAIITLSGATLVSFFYVDAIYDSKEVFKFITLILLMFSGLCYGRYLNVIIFVKISNVFTVLFILSFSFFKIAVMDPSANYLMYSMAIAFMAIANLGLAFYKSWDAKWLSFGVLLLLYCFTLHSRSAIIFTMLFLLFFIFIDHVIKRKLLRMLSLLSIMIVTLWFVFLYFELTVENISNLGYGAYKLIGMFSGEYTDDRGSLLNQSLALISNEPFGYGIGAFWRLLGYYPHNLFLETALNFGVFVSLIYFFAACIALFELARKRTLTLWFYALFYLYYLAVWMSSFDYLSAFQIHIALGCFLSCLSLSNTRNVPIKLT